MKKILLVIAVLMLVSPLASAGVIVDGGKQSVDVYDISKGTQTNDVKVTMDSETVTVDLAGNNDVTVTSGTITANLGATDNAVLDQIELNTDPLLIVGGGTEATAQRVTIANDSTGVLSIDDNDTSITVDGTFWQATQPISGTVTVNALPTGTNLIGDIGLMGNTAADGSGTDYHALIDTSGHLQVDVISGTGAGTEYAVDAALGTTPTGTLAIGKRDDALSALTPTEGDAVELRVDANGALWVIPSGTTTVDGTVTANLSSTDNAVLDQIELNTDSLSVVGGGTEATAQRVTIANDSTGVITVDGAVTVDMGANNDVTVDETLVTKTSSQDLSSAALAYTTNFAADTEIIQVLVHASGAITQTISVTFDSATGATYDTKLDSTDVTAATDYYWTPDSKMVIASGDEILVGCTNAGTPALSAYVTVIGKTVN